MASKAQNEVAACLNTEELAKLQNVISQTVINKELNDNDEYYEDADSFDESDQELPTPAQRTGKGLLSRGKKVFLDADSD